MPYKIDFRAKEVISHEKGHPKVALWGDEAGGSLGIGIGIGFGLVSFLAIFAAQGRADP